MATSLSNSNQLTIRSLSRRDQPPTIAIIKGRKTVINGYQENDEFLPKLRARNDFGRLGGALNCYQLRVVNWRFRRSPWLSQSSF